MTRLRSVTALVVLALLVPTATSCRSSDDDGPAASPPAGTAAHTSHPVTHRLPGTVIDTIGVASFNAYYRLGLRGSRHDWDRLTSDPAIDVIGWQEAKSPSFRQLNQQYVARGWDTWRWPDADGPIQLALSWRSATFALLGVEFHRMHSGGYPRQTDDPFPARWVVVARLRHLASGRTLTLLDTHLNQHIETGDHFEDNLNARRAKVHLRKLARLWDSAPGDLVVGTGDYNFDYADDSTARPAGGISRTIAGHATSSYDVLGLGGLLPTHDSRWIDYVWVADRTLRTRARDPGTGQFVRHRVLGGFRSDHRPIVATIRWYAGPT